MNNESRAVQAERDISVLLIDDDVELCELMREFFAARGIAVEAIHDGRRGLARALGGEHDLILLDVMLPGLDGFELLRQVRRRSLRADHHADGPDGRADRIAGLDAGADDYLPKPFEPEELIARIRAVLRRTGRSGTRRPGSPRSQRRPAGAGHARGLVRRQPRGGHDDRVRHPRADRSARPAGSSPATSCRRRSTGGPPRPRIARSTCTSATCGRKLGALGGLIRTIRGVGYLFCAEVGEHQESRP